MPILTTSWPSLFVFLFLSSFWIVHSLAAAPETAPQAYVYALCPDMTIVATNSNYQQNINEVLNYLSSNSSNTNRFYNTSVGSGHDKVYGLFFCCLDVTDAACKKCVSLATNVLRTRCPGKKDSTLWYLWRLLFISSTKIPGISGCLEQNNHCKTKHKKCIDMYIMCLVNLHYKVNSHYKIINSL